jgi:hypothetical protein
VTASLFELQEHFGLGTFLAFTFCILVYVLVRVLVGDRLKYVTKETGSAHKMRAGLGKSVRNTIVPIPAELGLETQEEGRSRTPRSELWSQAAWQEERS